MLAYHVLAALAAPLLLQGAPAPALKWEPSLLIQLQVADLDRSVRFYAETLGFKIAERRDDLGFAHVDCGIPGLQLGLSAVGSRPTAPGSVVLNFGVTGDIEAARKVLESRGVVFLGPTVVIAGKVRLAEFKDPDGHRLRLAIDDKLNSAMSSFETAAAKGRVRPERKARVQGIPGGMMLVRDVVGDYSQHPKVFAEMMAVRDASYVSAGDCFGIYPMDPDTVESLTSLRWRIGVRVEAKDGGQLRAPPAPYKLERLPAFEAAVVETSVADAALDGLAMLRWLPENGYVQSGPTRMEYLSHEGNPMLIPARIVVPIKKRRSGLLLP